MFLILLSLNLLHLFLFFISILVCCSTIKLWELTGQLLLDMIGHTSLVYSVDAHSSGQIASGSEDRSLKIWKGDIFFLPSAVLFLLMLDSFLETLP
jgi:WD40 repeat protein